LKKGRPPEGPHAAHAICRARSGVLFYVVLVGIGRKQAPLGAKH
jgi:hypothetical protein